MLIRSGAGFAPPSSADQAGVSVEHCRAVERWLLAVTMRVDDACERGDRARVAQTAGLVEQRSGLGLVVDPGRDRRGPRPGRRGVHLRRSDHHRHRGRHQPGPADPVRAANYYGGQGSIQTATIRTTDFQGNVTLQATLNDQPSIQAAWFDVDTYGDGLTPITEYHPVSVVGNFAHLRVHVENFDAGSIAVTASY